MPSHQSKPLTVPLAVPSASSVVSLPEDQPPVLLVVIDTEEEFDWYESFDRSKTSVGHMRSIGRIQSVFEEFDIRPVYVVDYPVASQADGAEPLRELVASGRAEVGAHLHPWVSPPHEEEVNAFHSYPGNLPPELERRKLEQLTDTIEREIGARPQVYKAGRYGLGHATPATLSALGFTVDLSPCPPFDYRADGGPDYSGFPVEPFWHGAASEGGVLAIPTTGAYVGLARAGAHRLYKLATDTPLARLRLPGILSRLGIVERLMLSPEGYDPVHHERITRSLLRQGCRTFTFSFHSPSVKPGCTPYVRDERDLERFLDACRRYFELFLGELGGVSQTALELRETVALAGSGPAAVSGTRSAG
jgi:hypothetical protein